MSCCLEGSPCVCMLIYWCRLGCGSLEQCFAGGTFDIMWVGIGVSPSSDTFVKPLHSKPVWSVNEVEDLGGVTGTFWLKSVCKWSLIVWRWDCSTHTGGGLCHCLGNIVNIAGAVGARFVDFQCQTFLDPGTTRWCYCGCVLAGLLGPSY